MGDWTAAAEAEKPVVPLLVADSEAYGGRSGVIYGRVIETVGMERVFMPQDGSRTPLRIIRTERGRSVSRGFRDTGNEGPRRRRVPLISADRPRTRP